MNSKEGHLISLASHLGFLATHSVLVPAYLGFHRPQKYLPLTIFLAKHYLCFGYLNCTLSDRDLKRHFKTPLFALEHFGWLHGENISCYRDQGQPVLLSASACLFFSFFFFFSGVWEHLVGFEELIHPFLWRLSSFLTIWKEALNAVGHCSSVYTHTFSLGLLTVAAARSISKAYVSQLWPQCQVPSNPWGRSVCE